MAVDVVIVCSPDGKKLDELPVVVGRGAKMSRTVDASRGTLSISANHPKATRRNLRTGNIVFVYSSEYPTIPNFGAVIWNPDPNGTTMTTDGVLVFGLRSFEWVLHKRLTIGAMTLNGTPGDKFKQILQQAQNDANLPISADYSGINTNGDAGDVIANFEPCYELANKIANDNDAYWWLDPVVNDRNMVEFRPMFRFRRSQTTTRMLVVGSDIRSASLIPSLVCEFVEIGNRITGIADSNVESSLDYTEQDNASVGKYQQVYHDRMEFPEAQDIGTLQAAVKAALKRRAYLKLKIEGIVPTAPYPRIGEVVSVDIGTLPAFFVNEHGSIIKMQCESTDYSPAGVGMAVKLTELISI